MLKKIFIFILIFLFLLLIYIFIFRKYIIRTYKFKFYIGKVGAGKTTLMIKHCLDFQKKCKRKKVDCIIYSNVEIKGVPIRLIDPTNITDDIRLLPGSLLLIDEPNLYWDNRDFKTVNKATLRWFRLYRHNQVNICIYSQTYDIDKKLRKLCTDIYLIRKYLGTVSVASKLDKNIEIADNALDAESQIVDRIKMVPFFIPTSREFYFIPKYSKYYDSFELKALREIAYTSHFVPIELHKKNVSSFENAPDLIQPSEMEEVEKYLNI